jgi:SsrA-binding protein
MAKKRKQDDVRIQNRRALHDYFIEAKIECGMALIGTEVKALRDGKAQLAESYARIDAGELMLHGCHIDPYTKAALAYNHEPRRPRKLLVHKKELRRLMDEAEQKGTSLIPLQIYFKDGFAKLELAVAKGKKQHDKRRTIKENEMKRDLRRVMTVKQR